MNDKKEYGDYQTPFDFALRICLFLKEQKKLNPLTILEPTCGIGNFLRASKIFNAEQYFGIEINSLYCQICAERFPDERLTIFNEDFFICDSTMFPESKKLLVLGNPPWATNSSISRNLPRKNNFKCFKGLEALTGASNFDICEYIVISLIERYRNTDTVFALLCKTSVARNVFKDMLAQNISFICCEIFRFDANKVFGINASACILFIQLQKEKFSPSFCNVYDFEEPNILKSSFGYKEGKFYSDLSIGSCDFDGKCCFEWRQGIKHDCSKIMELVLENGTLKNGHNEPVDAEPEIIFPLIKGSAIKTPVINCFSKHIIVTQRFLGEDTSHLEYDAPKVWKYLKKNIDAFTRRKSKIYNDADTFAMFGIGNYSYMPYKVCISGFNKIPLFALLFSANKKPVMLDDTTYFLGFEDYDVAYTTMIYLNSEKVRKFLQSISFADSKRPYTKKILSRIDFSKIYSGISFSELKSTETKLNVKSYLNEVMTKKFFDLINPLEQKLF